jgi:alkylation response protein AidB-like acyl-CoA dehydrogenase
MVRSNIKRRTINEPEHEQFREMVRNWVAAEVAPQMAKWDESRSTGREIWKSAGALGLLGLGAPERLGGGGQEHDYRYRTVLAEEFARVGAAALNAGFAVQEDVVLPYLLGLGSEDQLQRWVPGSCSGELIGAIAMTEPGAGSDLRGLRTRAVRVSGGWALHGTKTFITNGIQADYVLVVAKTDDPDGFTLFVVEEGVAGFSRGRQLEKIGQHAQDTAELFFDDVRISDDCVLGEPGRALGYLMQRLPKERLSIAYSALAAAEAALAWTVEYVKSREAFGGPLAEQQTVQFSLAEMSTEIDVTRSFLHDLIRTLNKDASLDPIDAAKAKWWASEMQKRVVDQCVQLHGGYGYMAEFPIARAFADGRILTIYGGATEIMKMVIGRDMVR